MKQFHLKKIVSKGQNWDEKTGCTAIWTESNCVFGWYLLISLMNLGETFYCFRIVYIFIY